MSEQKIYFGGVKEINGNFGTFHRISFSKTDLEEMMCHLDEKNYINLNMNKRREPSQWGQTHSLTLDTWKPEGQRQDRQEYTPPQTTQQEYREQEQMQTQAPDFDSIDDEEDLPF